MCRAREDLPAFGFGHLHQYRFSEGHEFGERLFGGGSARRGGLQLKCLPGRRQLPILIQNTLTAQNANIDMVSGATVTSTGYLQSLQSALDQAGLA